MQRIGQPEYDVIKFNHPNLKPLIIPVSSGLRVACLNPECPANEIARFGQRELYAHGVPEDWRPSSRRD